MNGHRLSSTVPYVIQMLCETVGQTKSSLPNVFHGATFTHNGINHIPANTGEARINIEQASREGDGSSFHHKGAGVTSASVARACAIMGRGEDSTVDKDIM